MGDRPKKDSSLTERFGLWAGTTFLALAGIANADAATITKDMIPSKKDKAPSVENACLGEAVIGFDGTILHARAIDTPMLMASTSKATAIGVAAKLIDEKVIDPQKKIDVWQDGRKFNMPVVDALKAMAVLSSNGAAVAVQKEIERATGKPFHEHIQEFSDQAKVTSLRQVEASGYSSVSKTLFGKQMERFKQTAVMKWLSNAIDAHADDQKPLPFNSVTPGDQARLTGYIARTYPLAESILRETEFSGFGKKEHKHNPFLYANGEGSKKGVFNHYAESGNEGNFSTPGKTGYSGPAGLSITFAVHDGKGQGFSVALMHCTAPAGQGQEYLSQRAEQMRTIGLDWLKPPQIQTGAADIEVSSRPIPGAGLSFTHH